MKKVARSQLLTTPHRTQAIILQLALLSKLKELQENLFVLLAVCSVRWTEGAEGGSFCIRDECKKTGGDSRTPTETDPTRRKVNDTLVLSKLRSRVAERRGTAAFGAKRSTMTIPFEQPGPAIASGEQTVWGHGQYDAGRILNKTQTLGAVTQTQSWQYDLAGSVKTATDGTVTTSVNTVNGTYLADPYDLVNHYRTVVGGTTLEVAYTYDNAHNVTSVTYPDAFTVSSNYNSLGQLTSIPGFATEGQYNFMGRLTSLAALNGTKREKTWNETTGSLDSYTYNVTGKTPRTLVWNEEGNVDSITKEGKTSTYLYDQLNRLVYASEQFPAEVKADETLARGIRKRDVGGIRSLDFNVSTQNVAFDTAATSIGIDLTSAQRINKIRLNAVDPRLSAKTVHVYTSLTGEEKSWTRVDRTTWIADQTGITVQFAQDVTARYVKINSTWDERNADNQTIDNHTVTANAVALLDVYFTVDGQTTSWTYDALGNRLSQDQVRGVQTQTAYTYYPNSNRIKTAGAWSFNYDANGNMTTRGNTGTWNAQTSNFEYDANAGEVWNYVYDLRNRLIEVKHSKAGTTALTRVVTYVYDIRDLRIAQTKQSETTYFQFDLDGDLLYKETATTKTKYVEALGQIWAEVRTENNQTRTYWHHTDYEGTTETITDATAKVVWDGSYEAFGSLVRSNGTVEFDASYTGRFFDKDIGLYYNNARFYDATLGRFLNSDPIRADGWNWYAYGSNNPLRYVDPTGLMNLGPVFEKQRAEREKANAPKVTKEEVDHAAEMLTLTDASYGDLSKADSNFELMNPNNFGIKTKDGSMFITDLEKDENKRSDFQAAIFRDKRTNKIVMAFAGTKSFKDAITDGSQAVGLPTDQYILAIDTMNTLISSLGSTERVEATGHSLGGGLSAAVASYFGLKATTFNAAGVNLLTIGGFEGDSSRITNFYVKDEILTTSQQQSLAPKALGKQVEMRTKIGDNLFSPFIMQLSVATGNTVNPINLLNMSQMFGAIDKHLHPAMYDAMNNLKKAVNK